MLISLLLLLFMFPLCFLLSIVYARMSYSVCILCAFPWMASPAPQPKVAFEGSLQIAPWVAFALLTLLGR